MKIAKTLSTLSLAFALQAGALVAAAVVFTPSDASAGREFDHMRRGDCSPNGVCIIKKPNPPSPAPMKQRRR